MAESDGSLNLTELTVEIVSAFVANNNVRGDDIPTVIAQTHAALASLGSQPDAEPAEEFKPAVSVRRSLASRDHIVSMIDGKPYRSLKRHLSGHGLTPATYRERYKLPASYPMVAPGYSEQRREVAIRLGLGRKPAAATAGQKGSARTPRRRRSSSPR